ncbi:TPA: hypothetical protein HA246_05715 [Candidatus Woesearchaeota archaeon]|nr:hypothetical protein [Candidatus Woesearchaeota archaeon]
MVTTTQTTQASEYLNKLVTESALVRDNASCKDNVAMLGEALLNSFGLDMQDPTDEPDLSAGYTRTKAFLERVCTAFRDPTHIVRVAPFAYAYLGSEMFERTLNVVLERARTHPAEQGKLDEVFTAAALLKPELWQRYLNEVKAASILDDKTGVLGLESIVADVDPKLSFTSLAVFPREFNTNDEKHATELALMLISMGLLTPSKGLSERYKEALAKMGSFEYRLKAPSEKHALFVTDNKTTRSTVGELRVGVDFEVTPEYGARPKNTGEYPAIVFMTHPILPKEVKKFYRQSTILYVARTQSEKISLEDILQGEDRALILDATDGERLDGILSANIKFVKSMREKGLVDFDEMLRYEVARAEQLIQEGNEFFYDVRENLQSIGREGLIDEMVAAKGYTLPKRTDYQLLVLLSDKGEKLSQLQEMFRGATRKKINAYSVLPPIAETGSPFAIITDMAVPKSQLLAQSPSTPIIYIADNDKQEEKIKKANAGENGEEVLVINIDKYNRLREKRFYSVGEFVVNAFFEAITKARKKGISDMRDVIRQISAEVKKARDVILFSDSLYHYYDPASTYYWLQETYRATPLVLQATDAALMAACPQGNCLDQKKPSTGCCGTNLPDIIIDFAIKYRKLVGEGRFLTELKAFHDGRVKKPWYMELRQYKSHFPGGLADARADDDMRF